MSLQSFGCSGFSRWCAAIVLLGFPFTVLTATGRGDDAVDAKNAAEPNNGSATPAEGNSGTGRLPEEEAGLSRRYRQFEATLLKMAEYLRKAEPERANLLMRAVGKSTEDRVIQQLEQISEFLKSDQFGDAIDRQEHVVGDLKALLELLQSEDRRHQLQEEKQWYESVQKDLGKLLSRQKELRKTTEGARNVGPLSERQRQIGEDAQSLTKRIDQQDAARNGDRNRDSRSARNSDGNKQNGKNNGDQNKNGDKEKKDGSNSDPKSPSDKNQAQKNPGSQNDKDGHKSGNQKSFNRKKQDEKPGSNKAQSKEGQNRQSDRTQRGKNSKKQQQGNGQPQEGQGEPQESPPGESQEQSQQEQNRPRKTPGREEIEEARRAMQKAEEDLKRLQKDNALEKQDQAIQKLAEARERLEKILRQLREEEQEIMLASLEARFARMLVAQIQIHVDTVSLFKTKGAWTALHFGRARELSVQEDALGDEAAKALRLLKEDGSSVAFPKGVEQIRDDMLSIARRIEKNDVREVTQSIEKDVIESLEELVASLQKEIENRKKPESRRQRQRTGQQGEGKQLVDDIAELKMLRSLQLRINRRTKQIGRLIRGEQATDSDLAKQLQVLARRQAEIQEATYILASGRNQ